MKKLNLSKFDLGMIIAAVVVTLLGGGAWWYLSGALQDAQNDDATAKADYDKYSSNAKSGIIVSDANGKNLQDNIDLLKAQLDPVIHTKLQPKENKLGSIDKEDPVAWKHDLDDSVTRLTSAAKNHIVSLPPNFYFGFSRYLNQNPNDEQTAVLSKQLVGIEEIANILINAPVKSIKGISRTYEEDPDAGSSPGATSEGDHLVGHSVNVPGNTYTAYPFEIDFESSPENLRSVIDSFMQSPYLLLVRDITVENSNPNSPLLTDLATIAGAPDSSVTSSSPGEVAATTSTKGPQFLFGNSILKVKVRVDMIQWNAQVSDASSGASTSSPAKGRTNKQPVAPSGP
jgi:hypothetical protein